MKIWKLLSVIQNILTFNTSTQKSQPTGVHKGMDIITMSIIQSSIHPVQVSVPRCPVVVCNHHKILPLFHLVCCQPLHKQTERTETSGNRQYQWEYDPSLGHTDWQYTLTVLFRAWCDVCVAHELQMSSCRTVCVWLVALGIRWLRLREFLRRVLKLCKVGLQGSPRRRAATCLLCS